MHEKLEAISKCSERVADSGRRRAGGKPSAVCAKRKKRLAGAVARAGTAVYTEVHEDSEYAFNGTLHWLLSYGKPPPLRCLRYRTPSGARAV